MTRYDTTYMPLPSPRPSNCLMRSRPSRPLHRPKPHQPSMAPNIEHTTRIQHHTPYPCIINNVHPQPTCHPVYPCHPSSAPFPASPPRITPCSTPYPFQHAHASPSVDTYPPLPSQQHITTHHITSHRIASPWTDPLFPLPSTRAPCPTPPLLS